MNSQNELFQHTSQIGFELDVFPLDGLDEVRIMGVQVAVIDADCAGKGRPVGFVLFVFVNFFFG